MHFYRTFSIADGKIFGISGSDNSIGNYLPVEIKKTLEIIRYKPSSFVNIDDYKRLINTNFSGQKQFYELNNTLVYFPTSYFPQLIGVFLGKLLKLNYLGILILGRMTNAIIYGFISYNAIKIIKKKYKSIILFVSLLPMSVYLSSSYSTDSILIASSLLFISTCFQDEQCSDLSHKNRIIQYLLGIVIILGKFTYFPILLLHWIKDRKSKVLIIPGIIFDLIMVSLVAGWNIFVINNVGSISDQTNINPIEQLKFILNSPFGYLSNLLFTMYNNFNKYVIQLNTLGWLSHTIAILVPLTVFLIVLFSITKESKNSELQKINLIDLMIIILTAFASIVLIHTALYLTWNPIGSDKIIGVQGRYFIPVLPLIMIAIKECFHGVYIQMKNPEKKLAIVTFIVLSFTIIYMFFNFWTSIRI